MTTLPDLVRDIGSFVMSLKLDDRAAAEAALAERFPAAYTDRLSAALLDAHAAGSLTPRPAGPHIRFGRLTRPAEGGGCAVDAVDIQGAGAPHTHPRGEVSWCIPLDGRPTFEGAPIGWVALTAGSHHAPTVFGGRMLIAYWTPGGEILWEPAVEASKP